MHFETVMSHTRTQASQAPEQSSCGRLRSEARDQTQPWEGRKEGWDMITTDTLSTGNKIDISYLNPAGYFHINHPMEDCKL